MTGFVTPNSNNTYTIDKTLLLTDIFGNHFSVHVNVDVGVAYSSNYTPAGVDFPPIMHVSSGGEAVYFSNSTIPWTSIVTQAGGTDQVSGSHDTATFNPLPTGNGLSGRFTVFDNVTPQQAQTLGPTFFGADNATFDANNNILPAQFSVALGGLGLPGASIADHVGAHAIQEVDINITKWSLNNNVLTGTYTIGAKEGTYDPSAPGSWVGFPNNSFLITTDSNNNPLTFSLNLDPTLNIDTSPPPPPASLPKAMISIDNGTLRVGEKDGFAHITLTRSFDLSGASEVVVQLIDGTATSPTNYSGPTSIRVPFGVGQDTAHVDIPINDDMIINPNLDFEVRLVNPVNATLGANTADVTIVDQDQPAGFPPLPAGTLVIPAGAATFTVPDPGSGEVFLAAGGLGAHAVISNVHGNHIIYAGPLVGGIGVLLGNKFIAGSGIDTYMAGAGSNTYVAGSGTTIVDYSLGTGATTINLANGTETGAFIGSNDTLTNIHDVVGTALNDIFIGSSSADTFSGGAGNDTFTGGLGNDTIDGGPGTDTAIFSGPHTAYSVIIRPDGSVQVSGPDGTDTLTNIEQLSFSDGTITAPKFPHWMASSDIGVHPAGYTPISARDFNGDGTSDVLWYNSTTNDIDLWKMSNGKWAGSVNVGVHPAGYSPAATADFNHDGNTDLLWYNPTSGDVDLWKLSNGQWAGSVDIGPHPLGWQPVGPGDFNADGTADVLWYNQTTNDAEVWMIQNGHWAASVDIGTHPAGYQLLGSADVDGDHTSDVIWFNPSNNDIDVWKISNGHWAGSIDIGTHPAGYTPVAAGDFNGDGTADLVWFNPTTGDVDVWLLQNGHWAASVDIGAHPTGWSPTNVGDFNHDLTPDILWRDSATNHAEAWLLSTG